MLAAEDPDEWRAEKDNLMRAVAAEKRLRLQPETIDKYREYSAAGTVAPAWIEDEIQRDVVLEVWGDSKTVDDYRRLTTQAVDAGDEDIRADAFWQVVSLKMDASSRLGHELSDASLSTVLTPVDGSQDVSFRDLLRRAAEAKGSSLVTVRIGSPT